MYGEHGFFIEPFTFGSELEIDDKVLRFGHRAAFAIIPNRYFGVRTIRPLTFAGNKSDKSGTPPGLRDKSACS